MPAAHRGAVGKQVESVVIRGVVVDVILRGAHDGSCRAWHPHRRGELCLATRSMQEHHHPTGDGLGHLGAVIGLDHCQREVDAGGDPGRRPHVSVLDVDGVGIDGQSRVFAAS